MKRKCSLCELTETNENRIKNGICAICYRILLYDKFLEENET